ncbi:MAG: VOC family protein [Prevotellaceae bacterium]|jgi:PhnB protein|nr:VOC family protein [Prevotellaceae bacterium]
MKNKYHTVCPWIVTKNTEKLIEFLKSAFNAYEHGRVYNNDGTIGHAEVQIGDSKILMFDAKQNWAETPAFLYLCVDNGDILYEQALKAGATSMTKMTTHSWGDRIGRIRDPFGNIWWITTHIEDLSTDEIVKRSQQKEFIEAMEYAQNSFNPFGENK